MKEILEKYNELVRKVLVEFYPITNKYVVDFKNEIYNYNKINPSDQLNIIENKIYDLRKYLFNNSDNIYDMYLRRISIARIDTILENMEESLGCLYYAEKEISGGNKDNIEKYVEIKEYHLQRLDSEKFKNYELWELPEIREKMIKENSLIEFELKRILSL